MVCKLVVLQLKFTRSHKFCRLASDLTNFQSIDLLVFLFTSLFILIVINGSSVNNNNVSQWIVYTYIISCHLSKNSKLFYIFRVLSYFGSHGLIVFVIYHVVVLLLGVDEG